MTIRELYTFAQSHALLDKSVGHIGKCIKHLCVHNDTLAHSNTDNAQYAMSRFENDQKNKVEFCTHEVPNSFKNN